MDIKELYKLYQQHPCITTDSRDCPEGSIFLALKNIEEEVLSLMPSTWAISRCDRCS